MKMGVEKEQVQLLDELKQTAKLCVHDELNEYLISCSKSMVCF
jgi:hypothetical protein